MNSSVHPYMLIAALGALVALVAIVIACRARRGIITAMMIVLALAFIVPASYLFLMFHPELVDGRFRTYKRFYRDIEAGMTREQVLAAMERHYPAIGPRERPMIIDDTPRRLAFFMNPETSREPNCEGIFLTLEAGRVTRMSYSAD
jgi:hypothetical protein